MRMDAKTYNRFRGQLGFTMLELSLAVTILVLVIVVAVASLYEHQARKARKQATKRLQEVAEWLHMQRGATRTGFADLLAPDWSSTLADSGYRISLARGQVVASDPKEVFPGAGPDTFTLLPEPEKSDDCGTLLLDERGRRGVTGTGARLADCWPR